MINLHKIARTLKFSSDILPKGVNISTITMTCSFETIINKNNIEKYMSLDPTNLVSIKYNVKKNGKILRKIRTLLTKKKKPVKKNKKQDVVNQVSMEIIHGNENERSVANVKLFTNGAVHIAGVKNLDDFKYLIKIVVRLLNKSVYVREKTTIKENGKKIKIEQLVKKPFYDYDKPINIKKIKINMINTNFKIKFGVNRVELYKILRKNKVECQYSPTSHAGVRIKIPCEYQGKKKKVSIFVFQSGIIIITGANNNDHLNLAYNYIIKILIKHRDRVSLDTDKDLLVAKKKMMLKERKI